MEKVLGEKWQRSYSLSDTTTRIQEIITSVGKRQTTGEEELRPYRALNQLISGHTKLNTHTSLIVADHSNLCAACNVPESIGHYLYDCDRYERHRDILNKETLEILAVEEVRGVDFNLNVYTGNIEDIQMEGFHKLQDDLEKVIEKDDSTSSITTDSDDARLEFRNCNDKLKHILNTNKFQILIIFFVIVDCLLVISELLLDLELFPSGSTDTIAPHVLHYSSLGILGLFMIEIGVRLAVFRLEFFKHKLEVFDAVVVIASFVLDLVFRNNEGPESGAGLLIVLRLWRVTRILNGIVLSVKKRAEKRIQRERYLRDACEQELYKYREYCAAQEREIETLRGLLRKHGITDIVPSELPPPASTIDVIAEVNQVDENHIADLKEKHLEIPYS